MIVDLTLLRFNNYFNRIIYAPKATIAAYETEYGATVLRQILDVHNFNPNDGISTTQILDSYIGESPDYCIVQDEAGNIVSRWFVMEATYTRNRQYQITLFRDVISDWYEDVVSAPAFIERATVGLGDPAIYNDEGMFVNQILTRKDLLYDETECPWIVGYIPKNYPESRQEIKFNYTPAPDITVTDIEQWEYYTPLSQSYLVEEQTLYTEANYYWSGAANNFKAGITLAIPNNGPITATTPTNADNWDSLAFESPIYVGYISGEADGVSTGNPRNFKGFIAERIAELDAATIYSYAKAHIGVSNVNPVLEELVGKLVFDSSTKTTYRIKRTTTTVNYSREYTAVSGPLWQALNPIFNARPDNFTNLSTDSFHLVGPYKVVKYELDTNGAEGQATLTINRTHLQDQPYDMFTMPYSNDLYFIIDGNENIKIKFQKQLAMGFAQQLAANIGSSAVFDIQILPYCPIKNLFSIDENGNKLINYKDIAATAINTIPDEESGESTQIGAIFWCPSSQFSFEIPYLIDLPFAPRLQKEMSICDKYRICSPNMASFFDFNPVKNGGVAAIEVDCYYKPFNPYIHLNPRFGGIYGGTTDYEVRGLDLAGNFSLTQVSDAWADYQLQNKNFQNVFDRQQENLDTLRNLQRIEQGFQVGAGALSAGAQAATVASVGGPWAAAGAGLAAAATSAVAGIGDIHIAEARHKENKSYNLDMFNYQIGNIQALPQSLTRIDALSPNNSLVPYIEYYTCTAIEREAIRQNLQYNGMTVNRVGQISAFQTYTPSFIQARLIRLPALEEDFHIAQTIADEISRGVFI